MKNKKLDGFFQDLCKLCAENGANIHVAEGKLILEVKDGDKIVSEEFGVWIDSGGSLKAISRSKE